MTTADIGGYIKKQPIGFACVVLILVLGGVYYYRSSEIEEKQAEYETKSAEAARIISNVAQSKNLTEEVAEMRALTKDMESRLVRAGQLAANLQTFYKLEAECEIKLLDIRQGTMPKTGAALYGGVPYNVGVQGSYKQIMFFLSRLETGRPFCHFSNVIFSKVAGGGSDGSSQNIMNVTISLELLGQP